MRNKRIFLWYGRPDQWKEENFSQKMTDPELAQRCENVAGEIKGSEAAMQYALDHKFPIIIYHDYQESRG